MNNLPKVVAQQRRGRASNPRLLDRKSDALPQSHRATPEDGKVTVSSIKFVMMRHFAIVTINNSAVGLDEVEYC